MLLGFFQIIMACVGLGLLTYLRSTCRGLLKDQALHVLLAVIVASQVRAWPRTTGDNSNFKKNNESVVNQSLSKKSDSILILPQLVRETCEEKNHDGTSCLSLNSYAMCHTTLVARQVESILDPCAEDLRFARHLLHG